MLRDERLQFILQKLSKNHRVTSTDLSLELKVSDDTIRRDLNELAEKGLLKKVHGGAIPRPAPPKFFDERIPFAHKEKIALAKKSLQYLPEGSLIILDGGTTNLEVAKAIPEGFHATIYTNSIPIAHELIRHPHIELVILGGKVFRNASNTIGHEALGTLDQIRADLCILGTCSVHHDVGVSVPFREEAAVKRKMVSVSDKTIILATHEKLGTASNHIICGISDVSTLIVAEDMEGDMLQPYREKGVGII